MPRVYGGGGKTSRGWHPALTGDAENRSLTANARNLFAASVVRDRHSRRSQVTGGLRNQDRDQFSQEKSSRNKESAAASMIANGVNGSGSPRPLDLSTRSPRVPANDSPKSQSQHEERDRADGNGADTIVRPYNLSRECNQKRGQESSPNAGARPHYAPS